MNRSALSIVVALSLALLSPTQEQASSQRPGFEATVARVRVDIIVTDAHGEFVEDLGADAFEVLEDGVVQQIVSLQLIDAQRGRVVDLDLSGRIAAAGEAPAEAVVSGEPDEGATPAGTELGAVIYVIDFPGLFWRNKYDFARNWELFLADVSSLHVPHAVYLINSYQRLEELVPLTLDLDAIREAAAQVRSRPLTERSLKQRILDGELSWPDVAQEERLRSLQTYETLTRLCASLPRGMGRTALVWVSSGVFLNDLDPLTQRNVDPDLNFPVGAIAAKQLAFHRTANSFNVSVYALDPSKRMDLEVATADASIRPGRLPGGGTLGERMLERVSRQRDQLAAPRDPLFNAAEETGGRAFVAWSDIQDALVAIEDDNSTYYLLTYRPPLPRSDSEYHEIEVRVDRPGLTVRARRGYVDSPEPSR